MSKSRAVTIIVVASIIVAATYLVLKQDGNPKSELTEIEIEALYAIRELGDRERVFCDFELVGESYVSVTLSYRHKVQKEELLDFLNSLVDECKKIERIDFYFAAKKFDKEIVDHLQLLDNISRIQVMDLISEEFSDEFDLVCQKMNWQRIHTKARGKTIFFNPRFEIHTDESLRRQELGWWGRLMEDIGIN